MGNSGKSGWVGWGDFKRINVWRVNVWDWKEIIDILVPSSGRGKERRCFKEGHICRGTMF